MNILKNKKIIISAGASGIGLATTKICLARGAYVYLCDIDKKSLNKLNKKPLKNKRLFTYHCDASNEKQVSDFFQKVKKKTKKIAGTEAPYARLYVLLNATRATTRVSPDIGLSSNHSLTSRASLAIVSTDVSVSTFIDFCLSSMITGRMCLL